jgi:hypothetical protein
MIVPQKITAGRYSLPVFGNGVFYFSIALFCHECPCYPNAPHAGGLKTHA